MRRTTLVIYALLLCLACGIAVNAAPGNGDDPRQDRALRIIAKLADRGFTTSYSGWAPWGDRQMSRWEVALQLAELSQVVEEKELEFHELAAVMLEYVKELKALGVRIGKLEKKQENLEKRVTELERIRFYGDVQTSFVAITLGGETGTAGTLAENDIDWVTGRQLTRGSSFSGLLNLGAKLDINSKVKADVVFANYYSQGDPIVDMYWGVTPPFLSNPCTSFGGSTPGIQSADHTPFTRTTLDRLTLEFPACGFAMETGSFNPSITPQGMVMGMRNPNVNAPSVLPFYGFDLKRRKEHAGSWELYWARLPQPDYADVDGLNKAYFTWLGGGSYSFTVPNGKLTLAFARIVNEIVNNGVDQAPTKSILQLPNAPWPIFWYDSRGAGTARAFTGPQEENIYGLHFAHTINPWLSWEAEGALSSYVPDRTTRAFDAFVQGSLARITLNYRKDRFDGRLDLFHVSSTYDPMVLRYPQNTNTPPFMPYGAYYSNYWQMHDYVSWPDNRVGLRLTGNCSFNEKTRLHYHFATYGQVEATLPADAAKTALKPGMVEPIFPVLVQGGTEKGSIFEGGASLAHQFRSRLTASLSYYHFTTNRAAPANDYLSNREDFYSLDFSHPVTESLRANAGCTFVDFAGRTGSLTNNFSQLIPYVGINVKIRENAYAGLTWRSFLYRDLVTANRNWNAGQMIMEYKMKF